MISLIASNGFFSKKIIFAKTQYKTYDGDFLAIIKVFKTYKHYLKGYKYVILLLIDYNKLQYFVDTKRLSFR